MIKRWGQQFYIDAVMIVSLLCIFLYGISRIYGFSIYPDEFGYWSVAAKVNGYDWSNVASLGSFYSYGYSIVLIPIMFLCKNGVTAYRIAIACNSLFLFLIYILLRKILRSIYPEYNQSIYSLIAGMAVLYPSWIYYSQMTLVEVFFTFCFTLLVYLFLNYLEKNSWQYLAGSLIMTAFLYMVHMRALGIAIAFVLTLGYYHFGKWKSGNRNVKRTLWVLLVLIILIVMVIVGKEIVRNTIYKASSDLLISRNTLLGNLEKVKWFFTKRGFYRNLVSLAGKIYYLGMSSFGLFYFGMAAVMKKIITKDITREKKAFYLLLGLAILGEIGICSIFTSKHVAENRIDEIFYGRYDENVIVITMVLGAFFFMEMVHKWRAVTGVLVVNALATVYFVNYIQKYEIENLENGHFINGLSYLLKYMQYESSSYFYLAFLLLGILTLVISVLLLAVKKKRFGAMVLLLFWGVEIILGIISLERCVYPYNENSYVNLMVVEKIFSLKTENRRIVTVQYEGEKNYISAIQFQMWEEPMYIIPREQVDMLEPTDIVVIDYMIEDVDYLQEQYEKCKNYRTFTIYYNE